MNRAMSRIDASVLGPKLDALASFGRFDASLVDRFGRALDALDDWEAIRINPLRFAETHGFDAADGVELFVHGAKVGLFDFVWNQICPWCGALVGSYESVNALEAVARCATCDVEVESQLDDQVEVAFAVNPAVRRVAIDPYADAADYWRYFISANFEISPQLEALIAEAQLATALLGPDRQTDVAFEAEAGCRYRLISLERHVVATIETAEGAPSEAAFEVLPGGLYPTRAEVAPGAVRLAVRNLCKGPTGAALLHVDPRIAASVEADPPRLRPFLTGKMLLNNQSFRDLFRVQHLVPDLRLPLRSLTLLFTDLKGSTELYDRTGDAYAYALVQEHYAVLSDVVRENSGAVIKTMGDAIMASFSHPLDAARAAVAMIERIDALNARWREDGHELGLKVGLHEGPALAVNADDRLDYFGQTVNIAARVQALAQAGEIWHTEEVAHVDGVEELFSGGGYRADSHEVSLKGVGQPVRVVARRRAVIS